jgi:hypothetical protein
VKTKIALTVLFVVVMSAVLSGCTRVESVTSPSPGQARPTTSPTAGTTQSAVPIVDDLAPTSSGKDRAALLSAAHSATGIKDDFIVWQFYRQGDTAVGDLQGSKTRKRQLVAFTRSSGTWNAVYQVKYLDAARSAVATAVPTLSTALLAKLEFVVPVQKVPSVYGSVIHFLQDREVETNEEVDANDVIVYAPQRLPDGFVIGKASIDLGTGAVRYSAGDKRLVNVIWLGGDVGEDDLPRPVLMGLRYGSEVAGLDPHCNFIDNSGTRTALGPYLVTDSGSGLSSLHVSPAIVAAVGSSMVAVDRAGKPHPSGVYSTTPTKGELRFVRSLGSGSKAAKIEWRGKDAKGNWWALVKATWTMNTYRSLFYRNASGIWSRKTLGDSAGGVYIDNKSLLRPIPSGIVRALKRAGIPVIPIS